jgi:formylglycine-generating enzyme required for sulfatase activity
MLWQLPLGHQRRAALAERLAIFGDPRRGIGLGTDGLPEIDWVAIDSGEVTIEIRAKPDDPNSKVVKTLTFTVAPFAMARYPVTIAQFRAFVAACFRDGVWQLPPGFTGKPPEKSPPEHKGSSANHGADSVSWDDAQAFCHWLSAGLGMNVRLPTEAEWQLAATGGDTGRTWPWGADWNPKAEQWLANTWESGLGRTLPVGFYPLGASPARVMDMAGNVWEWCSNAFDDKDPGVLRSGSRICIRVSARPADRNSYNTYTRNYDFGFRVACSSPSSGR